MQELAFSINISNILHKINVPVVQDYIFIVLEVVIDGIVDKHKNGNKCRTISKQT